MRLFRQHFLTLPALCCMYAAGALAQEPDPLNSPLSLPPPAPTTQQRLFYRDLDLLRQGGFAAAAQVTVSLRIEDRQGTTPAGLQLQDFHLVVNGTVRTARLHVPGMAATGPPPMVLLVLPPNQPVVHWIALKNAKKYFAAQPAELLPWNVGILDANGKLTPYTNGRSQLLVNLDAVERTPEPFQFSSDIGMATRFHWDSNWLTKAQDAIGAMQRFAGAKVVLAINPLADQHYGLNDQMFAHDGPDALVDVSRQVGAHIYIANVGGPEVYVPGGEAASNSPAQTMGAGGLRLGTNPGYHMQVDPEMIRADNAFAYNTSQMMMSASATMGGFSNSLGELAGKIHHDLDGNYALEFDMTPEDTDRGAPKIEVSLTHAHSDLRLAVLDAEPVLAASDAEAELASRELLATLRKSASAPASSDFRIIQHVDSFPMHGGLEPVLPMSGAVEWTGAGAPPRQITVLEAVEDPGLSQVILERSLQAQWNGSAFTWERDGVLRPGEYVWRVAVANSARKVLAYSEEKIPVGMPRHEAVPSSSLIVGDSCRVDRSPSGLQPRPKSGDAPRAMIDPMQAQDCRVRAHATDVFLEPDVLRAFIRIYPVEKLEKHKPESWTAHFALRASSGDQVEAERDVPFATDSGSGYLASVTLPLSVGTVHPGPHVLAVTVRGPGVRGKLEKSRTLSIAGPPEAAGLTHSKQREQGTAAATSAP